MPNPTIKPKITQPVSRREAILLAVLASAASAATAGALDAYGEARPETVEAVAAQSPVPEPFQLAF